MLCRWSKGVNGVLRFEKKCEIHAQTVGVIKVEERKESATKRKGMKAVIELEDLRSPPQKCQECRMHAKSTSDSEAVKMIAKGF